MSPYSFNDTRLEALPQELFDIVTDFLDAADVLVLHRVSKEFRAKSDAAFRKSCFADYRLIISLAEIISLAAHRDEL